MFLSAKIETTGAGVEKLKIFSKSQQFYYQNFPCDPIKKMSTHFVIFPLKRKL